MHTSLLNPVIKWPAVGLCILGMTSGFVSPLLAQDELEVFFGYYQDDGGLDVITPSMQLIKDLREDTTVSAKYTFERFDKSAPDNALDAVSGATTVAGGSGSGFSEIRHETVFSGQHQRGSSTLAMGLFLSEEEDFSSRGVSVSAGREMFQRNLTITGMYSLTADEIENAAAPPSEGFPRDKTTHSYTVAASQLLDPRTIVVGGYNIADVAGYQSQPLRKVAIETTVSGGSSVTIYEESHPEQRLRHTVFVRGKRYLFQDTSADLNLAYYRDDWGVSAQSVDLRLNRYLRKDLIARLRYRFYGQGEAEFYKPSYDAPEAIMTADTRLRAFDSHLAGLKLTYRLRRGGPEPWQLSAAYDRYQETNSGLGAHIFKLAVRAPF